MEYYNENGFLEELLALRSDSCSTTIPVGMNELNTNGWSFDGFDDYPYPTIPSIPSISSSFEELITLPIHDIHQSLNGSFSDQFYSPFGIGDDQFSAPENFTDNSSTTTTTNNNNNNKLDDTPPFPTPEDYSLSILEDNEELGQVGNGIQNLEVQTPCKMEPIQPTDQIPSFNMGTTVCQERKNKVKKMDGQPSKNLMAERRRRKRLNDRLSMLRSVVPKISKMDRTSILGDTIDYMKELLERINNLQEEIEVGGGSNQLNIMSIFKEVKPNEVVVRNSPKFDVERRDMDTRIEICCAGKPGLLLSTVSSLEALGLEIQQCVISCFNDFALQASCSEELEQRAIASSEDIKQTLFRNAGYGGRCF